MGKHGYFRGNWFVQNLDIRISNVQLENILIIPLYFTRCLLPCVWVHGPWLNGAARIWLGTFLRGPYQVFHETVNGRSGLLSQKEFPSSRYQVLQHLTEQQVTWQSARFFASSFPCILPGFSWKHSVVVFALRKLRNRRCWTPVRIQPCMFPPIVSFCGCCSWLGTAPSARGSSPKSLPCNVLPVAVSPHQTLCSLFCSFL